MNKNPLLFSSGLPPFDQIKPEHIVPAMTELLATANHQIDIFEASLTSNFSPSWNNLIAPIDDIERPVFRAWGPVGHLLGVMNSDEIRLAHEAVQPEIVKFGLRTAQSKQIYDALIKLKASSAWANLIPPRKRIIERNILVMKLSGVSLDGPEKTRYNEVAQELAATKTKFSNNALDSTKAWSMTLTSKD